MLPSEYVGPKTTVLVLDAAVCSTPRTDRTRKMHSVGIFLIENGAEEHLRSRCTAWYARCPHHVDFRVLEPHQNLRCHNRPPARLRRRHAGHTRSPRSRQPHRRWMAALKALMLAVIRLPARLLSAEREFDETSRRDGTCLVITDPAPTPDARRPCTPARPSWALSLFTRRRGFSMFIHVAVFETPRASSAV